MRTTSMILGVAPLALAFVMGSGCSGVNVVIADPSDGGDDDAAQAGDAGDAGDGGRSPFDGGKRVDGGGDASVKRDPSDGCPPPNVDVCGLPCTTPGLQCPGTSFVQCTRQRDGTVIWLCASSTN